MNGFENKTKKNNHMEKAEWSKPYDFILHTKEGQPSILKFKPEGIEVSLVPLIRVQILDGEIEDIEISFRREINGKVFEKKHPLKEFEMFLAWQHSILTIQTCLKRVKYPYDDETLALDPHTERYLPFDGKTEVLLHTSKARKIKISLYPEIEGSHAAIINSGFDADAQFLACYKQLWAGGILNKDLAHILN